MHLEIQYQHILMAILKKYPVDFYLFGSRAKGTTKPLSDIDLLVKEDLPKATKSRLREELEESRLPMKVDLVFWPDLEKKFQDQIAADLQLISSFNLPP